MNYALKCIHSVMLIEVWFYLVPHYSFWRKSCGTILNNSCMIESQIYERNKKFGHSDCISIWIMGAILVVYWRYRCLLSEGWHSKFFQQVEESHESRFWDDWLFSYSHLDHFTFKSNFRYWKSLCSLWHGVRAYCQKACTGSTLCDVLQSLNRW